MNADRRRFNPPAGGTSPPIFESQPSEQSLRSRKRSLTTPRKIFLHTGIVPSASGSAYLEQHPDTDSSKASFTSSSSALKLICTVHGPRPLPRNQPFSSTLVLNTHLKYAPFASRRRKGYIRDPTERDLGAHLETALRGVIIGERWPKSAVEVIITVLEGESDEGLPQRGVKGIGTLNVLAGAITAASAALVDAGIDCVDLITGGVAALSAGATMVDPGVGESLDKGQIDAACVVGYLQARDEMTELWTKGDVGVHADALMDRAVAAAAMTRSVLAEALKESTAQKLAVLESKAKEELAREKGDEVDMVG